MSFLQTGLVQKIRTFAFLPNRTFPKNPDFHQKPLPMRGTHASPDFKRTTVYLRMRPKFLQIPAAQTEKRNKEDFTGILHKLLEFHNFYYFMTSD